MKSEKCIRTNRCTCHGVSRRKFLQATGAAAVAASLPAELVAEDKTETKDLSGQRGDIVIYSSGRHYGFLSLSSLSTLPSLSSVARIVVIVVGRRGFA